MMKTAAEPTVSKHSPNQANPVDQRGIAIEIAVLAITLIGIAIFAALPSAAVLQALEPVDHFSAKVSTFSTQVERGLLTFYR
jgi:hypothetical protein